MSSHVTATTPPSRARDSMKSTWRLSDKKTWAPHNWILHLLQIHPTKIGKPIPVHAKDDPMPYLPHSQTHLWVLTHALWPCILQQLYCWNYGKNLSPLWCFVLYTSAYHITGVQVLHMLTNAGHKYGFLDGDKHARDQVPDASVQSTVHSLILTALIRPLMAVMLTYKPSEQPISFSWWVVAEIGLYPIVLDFYFYWYHRTMHEVDGLWQFHRQHHLTKHPTPLLTLFADHEQEVFDIVIIPLLALTTMKIFGFPMGFYEFWICSSYIFFTELVGHSGLRILSRPPSTNTPFVSLIDAELLIEDHDLHHRKGYRKSSNYGKQTKIWDMVFGTTGPRYETLPSNFDFTTPVYLTYLPWQ